MQREEFGEDDPCPTFRRLRDARQSNFHAAFIPVGKKRCFLFNIGLYKLKYLTVLHHKAFILPVRKDYAKSSVTV